MACGSRKIQVLRKNDRHSYRVRPPDIMIIRTQVVHKNGSKTSTFHIYTMSSYVRSIMIDDTDTSIKYIGQGWFQDAGDGSGTYGTPYLNTRHGTNGNDGFSFSFTGDSSFVCSAVAPIFWTNTMEGTSLDRVIGTTVLTQIPIVNGTGNGTTWDPKWECFLDGVSIGSTQPFPYVENRWGLCEGNAHLANGYHTLTLNVTTMGNTFWFDHLRFTPSSDYTYGNGTNVVFIGTDDPAIECGVGWGPWSTTSSHTVTEGSQLKLNFTGLCHDTFPTHFPLF